MSSRLREQVDELHGLYEQMSALVFEKETAKGDETQHHKISHSAFPGSSRYWTWVLGVRAGTRHAESDLEIWCEFRHVYRSMSDRNTHASLSRLPILAEARTVPCPREGIVEGDGSRRHGLICAGVGYAPHVVEAVVDRWWNTARELLEIEEAWQRIPEPAGQPIVCSVCGNRSLRWKSKARRMRCFYPGCSTEWTASDLEFLAHESYEAS